MKHSYYDFVSIIMFNINYSSIYRLRAEASWDHLAFSSNLLLTYTQHSQRINISVHCYINSEILILIPCKLPFIEPWCDLSGSTKNLAIERLTLLMLKRKSRKAFGCINCCIIFYHKCNVAISSEKTHKPCHRAAKVTVCVNPKPIQDSFSGFKLIALKMNDTYFIKQTEVNQPSKWHLSTDFTF